MFFYVLSDKRKRNFGVHFAKGNDWEGIYCPVNKGHQRAGKRNTELKVDLPSKKVPHFLCTMLGDYIITEEVAAIFEDAGLTGYTLKPVIVNKVKSGNKHEVPTLWEFIAIGNGGAADPASGIQLIETCGACNLEQYSSYKNGIIIDTNQWDGSDFFTVVGYPKRILVTERAKDIITMNKLSNVLFTLSHELRWPEGVIRPEDVVDR